MEQCGGWSRYLTNFPFSQVFPGKGGIVLRRGSANDRRRFAPDRRLHQRGGGRSKRASTYGWFLKAERDHLLMGLPRLMRGRREPNERFFKKKSSSVRQEKKSNTCGSNETLVKTKRFPSIKKTRHRPQIRVFLKNS